MGLVGAFAVMGLAGVGFSAFTASATVYGTASAGTVSLVITETESFGCSGAYANGANNGSMAFSPVSEDGSSVSASVSNIVPGEFCDGLVVLENTGSVPFNVSVAFNTPGANGMCIWGERDCYDVNTLSGIQVSGWLAFCGPCNFSAEYSVTNITTLNPGQTYTDYVAVSIPQGADDGTPPTGSFSLVYTGSAGF